MAMIKDHCHVESWKWEFWIQLQKPLW